MYLSLEFGSRKSGEGWRSWSATAIAMVATVERSYNGHVSDEASRTYLCRYCGTQWDTHYGECPACTRRGGVVPTGMKFDLNAPRRSGLVVLSKDVDRTPVKRIKTGIKNL